MRSIVGERGVSSFGTLRKPAFIRGTVVCFFVGLFASHTVTAAQVAVTSPRGIYTVKVPGTTQANEPVRTYLGIQLLPDPRFVGLAATVNGSAVSLANLGNHSVLATPVRNCYLHVLTGNGRGFVVDINQYRTSDIVCAEDLTPWLQPGGQVKIRPHPQLLDILGATNRFGLGAGTNAGAADNVVIWDPDTQQERIYYFNSTRFRWEEKDIVADASVAVFRFPYGFYIVRRTPGTLRIALSGDIGADAVLLPVRSAANVFSLPINLSATLDGMVRASGNFSVISGPNAKRSDLLTLEEPTTGLQRGPFYHLSRPNASGWREVGKNSSSASIEPLDFLSTLILRRDGDPGRVFVEGSQAPPAVPRPELSPDPEPGELPITEEFPYTRPVTPNSTLVVETCTDLQSWVTYTGTSIVNGKATFALPSGQRRAFYRLKITAD